MLFHCSVVGGRKKLANLSRAHPSQLECPSASSSLLWGDNTGCLGSHLFKVFGGGGGCDNNSLYGQSSRSQIPKGSRHKQDLATLRLGEVQSSDSQMPAQWVFNHLELPHSLNLTFWLTSSSGCFCTCSDQAEAKGSKYQLPSTSHWQAETTQVAPEVCVNPPPSSAQQHASQRPAWPSSL